MAGPAASPFSARPSSVKSPVPSKEKELSVDELLAQADSLDIPAVPAQEEPSVDALLADEPSVPDREAALAPTPEVPADQFAAEPGFAQANVDQFQNIVTRIQTGLAANDEEKFNFLSQKFGPENVTKKNDNIYFRRASGEKFKRLDPATLEIVNDLIPDFAREIVTEGAMLPGELAGGAAGGPAGAIAGRVASVPHANLIADKVAEFAGVPKDESRSSIQEAAVGMGAEAVLPVVGKAIVRNLPGTMAYQAAKKAGEREIVALSKQSEEVAKAVSDLSQMGLAAKVDSNIVGIPGANVSLMGHQLNPDNPVLQRFANTAASDPRFINAQNQLAQDWGKLLDNTFSEIALRGGKGPLRSEKLAESVTNAVVDLEKAEGQAIGKFRLKATAKLKNQRIPMSPEVSQAAQELTKEFGFKIRPTKDSFVVIPPNDLRPLVGKMGLTSAGEVRSVVNGLNDLAQSYKKGLTISDLDRIRNTTGSLSDSLFRTQAGAKMGALSGMLRKDFRAAISGGLDNEIEAKAFNSAMDEFSALKTNIGVIKGALNEDASAKAIVKSFFTGKENLQKIEAIKKISPESFSALKEEWVNQMLTEYGSREAKTGFKSKAFLDALDKKYGREFVSKVLDDGPGPNFDTVRKILSVTERIESQFKNIDVNSMSEAKKKAAMDAFIGLMDGIGFKIVNGFRGLLRGSSGKDHILTQIMTRDGIDKYVGNYPGKIDKVSVMQNLNDIMAQNKFFKAIEEHGPKVEAPRAARRLLVDEAMDEAGGREQ